jgi:hypothetical protein
MCRTKLNISRICLPLKKIKEGNLLVNSLAPFNPLRTKKNSAADYSGPDSVPSPIDCLKIPACLQMNTVEKAFICRVGEDLVDLNKL